MNIVDECLEFKMSTEENSVTNYLDLSINRNASNIDLRIYRKPTYIDITIHFSSNHLYGHKLVAFNYYTKRMLTMPISERAMKQECNKILIMARSNGFPTHLIHGMKKQPLARKEGTTQRWTNNTTRNGSLSLFTAPQCTRLSTYSKEPTWR